MIRYHLFTVFIAIIFFSSCSDRSGVEIALNSINEEELKTKIAVLASDEFQGRFPSTIGEEKTTAYLIDRFTQIGLQPGNGSSFLQEVSLVKLTAVYPMKMQFTGGKQKVTLNSFDDFIGGTPQPLEKIDIKNSDLVFVGFGINAPDYQWNDYEGIDVKGKTVLILVNDPGYYTKDSMLFEGNAMTYEGRWTYKYEEAARQGATAAIIIHETGAAAYPWGVVQNSWSGTNFYLEGDELSNSNLMLTGWVTEQSAAKLIANAGYKYEDLLKASCQRGFRAVDLKQKLNLSFNNKVEHAVSNNVAALYPGTKRADELVIYTAHWDHFGVNPALEGDSILNGAVDNATGTAALLELAEAFRSLKKATDRSVLFVAVTCEEQGLLGSDYYAKNPLFPLNKTVAVINMDGLNIFGKTKDMTISGKGYNEIDSFAVDVLKKYGRYATGDATPEKGMYFRSDHFSFAKVGVPSINMSSGIDNIEHGRQWALDAREKWIMENYHKPSDNYDPVNWKFDGMIEDIKVYFELGYNLATTDKFPNWKNGVPYKVLRDEMMEGVTSDE